MSQTWRGDLGQSPLLLLVFHFVFSGRQGSNRSPCLRPGSPVTIDEDSAVCDINANVQVMGGAPLPQSLWGFEPREAMPIPGADSIFSSLCGAISGRPGELRCSGPAPGRRATASLESQAPF